MSVDRIRARRAPVLGSMLRLLTYVTVALAVPLALIACGDEGEEAAGQTVEVVGTEFAFDPSTINLDESGTYTFHLVNDGEFEHALEIDGHGVEDETDVIGGGETADVTVELTEEGEYEMYCPVGNHREMGMEGTVIVGGGAGAGTDTGGATTEHETTTEEETTTEDDGY
jgi:plastocyanin